MKNIYFPNCDITIDDLKFVCYMIERTARRCKQPNANIVEHIGKDELKRKQLDNYNCSAYYEPSYVIARSYNQGNFN